MGFTEPMLPPGGSCPNGTEGVQAPGLSGCNPLHHLVVPLPLRGRI